MGESPHVAIIVVAVVPLMAIAGNRNLLPAEMIFLFRAPIQVECENFILENVGKVQDI